MSSDKFKQHFDHFDTLVADWLKGKEELADIDYLPEPWWGWCDDGTPLHAVVVNFNPGKPGDKQLRDSVGDILKDNGGFRGALQSGKLRERLRPTENWHKNNRQKRILNALSGQSCEDATETATVLSLELYPHHTTTVEENKIKEYLGEIASDQENNLLYLLRFAANASRQIEPYCGQSLNGMVILRMTYERFQRLTKELIQPHAVGNEWKSDDGSSKMQIFKLSEVPGITFACIWGPRSRNYFPPKLAEAIQKVMDTHHKNQ